MPVYEIFDKNADFKASVERHTIPGEPRWKVTLMDLNADAEFCEHLCGTKSQAIKLATLLVSA